jgi:hypothetical protein
MGNSEDSEFLERRKANYFVPYFPTAVQKKKHSSSDSYSSSTTRFLRVSAESHVGPASASSMSESTIPVAIYHGLQRAAGITKLLPRKLSAATDTALINCITLEKTSLTATDIRNQQEGLLNLHKAR